MNSVDKIKCQNCGTEIDVNMALSHEIEMRLKTEFSIQNSKNLIKIEKLRKEKEEIESNIIKEKDKEYKKRLEIETDKIREEVIKENEDGIISLQKSLKEKSEQVIDLNKIKAELEKLKLEKNEIESKIIASKDIEFSEKLMTETEKIKKESANESFLKIAELQKKLDDQTALAEEMRRKAEQGSMQLQGEVQEVAIENILRDIFRLDVIESVPKGIKGADVIHRVQNNIGQEVGIIVYESKRTKTFNNDWLCKLKEDGGRVNADIFILVTDALPEDIEKIGQKEGVWICTFTEVKGLALVLRDSIIRVSEAYSSQTNKGEKMQMLYDYLTGNEFSLQFRLIIETFDELQKGYLDERKKMEKIWKEREKQLQKIVLNTSGFIGSIKGIAGNTIIELPLIEGNS